MITTNRLDLVKKLEMLEPVLSVRVTLEVLRMVRVTTNPARMEVTNLDQIASVGFGNLGSDAGLGDGICVIHKRLLQVLRTLEGDDVTLEVKHEKIGDLGRRQRLQVQAGAFCALFAGLPSDEFPGSRKHLSDRHRWGCAAGGSPAGDTIYRERRNPLQHLRHPL